MLCLILWPAVLKGQSTAPDQPCIFEGEVVSAASGDPIAGARLIAQSWRNGGEAITDAAGHFCIRSVPPGPRRYHLLVVRKGFVSTYYGENPPSRVWQEFSVSTSSAFRNLAIRLVPAAEINGHVYDENDDPFQRITVEAAQEEWRGGRLRLEPSRSAKTNSDGYYRIEGLAPGNYLLRAMVHGSPPSRKLSHAKNEETSGDISYVPSFYPSTLDFRGAGVVNLRGGDERGPFDFHLHAVPAYYIRGEISVAGPLGDHLGNVEMELLPQDPDVPDYDLYARHSSFKTGPFVIRGVPPGAYELLASSNLVPQYVVKGKTYGGRVNVTVGEADVDGVRLLVVPDFDLPGRVTVSGIPLKVSGLRIGLDFKIPAGDAAEFADVNPGGTFVLNGISEETAKLELSGCGNCYVKSVKLGGVVYPPSRIDITRTAAASGLEITVSTDGAQTTGLVIDGHQKPAVGAYVVIVPETPSPATQGFYRTAFTDNRGQFGIAGLPPGDYLVFAWPSPQDAAFEEPAFIEQHREEGFSVTLMPGQVRNIQIPLLPAPTPAQ
ncbi:MAG: carboxypeptidase-like regulatory domain-containing protein [Terriglobia bacterium]